MSPRASPPATLHGRWLVIARAAWIIIATLAVGLFVASIPGYVSNVLKLGQAASMGTPVEAPAGMIFVLDLLGVLASVTAALVCLILTAVLFWRKPDDWMVMFVSLYLLLYGTVMAGPLERAEAFYPWWPYLAVDVVQSKWVVFGILVWLVLLTLLSVPYMFELNLPAGNPLPWWALVSSTG
jgi:hypothetical protein